MKKKIIYFFLCFYLYISCGFSQITAIYHKKNKLIDTILISFKRNLSGSGIYPPFSIEDKDLGITLGLLKKNNFECVLAIGDQAAAALMRSGVKGVFILVMNPVKMGLIDQKGVPLSNITGISALSLKNEFITLNKIFNKGAPFCGIVYNPANSGFLIHEIVGLNMASVIEKPCLSPKEVMPAFSELTRNKIKIDFNILLPDSTVFNKINAPHLFKFSILEKIPLIGFSKNMTKSGALISFYPDGDALGKQAAEMSVSIAKGNFDFSKPILNPDKMNYSINKNTATLFNIDIPDEVLSKASEVILSK